MKIWVPGFGYVETSPSKLFTLMLTKAYQTYHQQLPPTPKSDVVITPASAASVSEPEPSRVPPVAAATTAITLLSASNQPNAPVNSEVQELRALLEKANAENERLKREAEDKLKQTQLELAAQAAKLKEEREALERSRQKNIEEAAELKRAAEDKIKLEREKLQKEAEEQQKEAELALLAKIQAMAKERATQLKKEQQAAERMDKKHNAENLKTNGVNTQKTAFEERTLLIKALQEIIDDPRTIIQPKPVHKASEFQEAEPFDAIEQFVANLNKRYVPVISDLLQAAANEDDPYNLSLERLATLIKKDPKELKEVTLTIQVHDLDTAFGMVSRRKRVLNGSALSATAKNPASNTEENELTFGGNKGSSPIVLHFHANKNGSYKVDKVVRRDIKEFEEPISDNLGIVLTGSTRDSGTQYLTFRKQRVESSQ